MRWLRHHPIACYLAIAFAVTWGAWLPLVVTGRVVTLGFSPLYLLGLLGPLISAVITTAIVAGTSGLRALAARIGRVRVTGWGIALGLPLALAAVVGALHFVLLTFGFGHAHTWRDLGAGSGFPVTSPLVMWLLLIAINGFGEETGWRGYLLPHLQRRWSPLVASLIVGAIWGAWHLPLFAITETYRTMSASMIPMFFAALLSASIVATWLYNRGRSSIALVAVWHGTYSWLSGSVAGRGALAAVETMAVMAIAVILLVGELRAIRRERHGQPARHVMTGEEHHFVPPAW